MSFRKAMKDHQPTVLSFLVVLLIFFIAFNLWKGSTSYKGQSKIQGLRYLLAGQKPGKSHHATFDYYKGFKNMTQAQEEIKRLATSPTVSCEGAMRKTSHYGYEICASDLYGPKKSNCIIYSLGIDGDASFDNYLHDEYLCDVRMFDPTMKQDSHIIKPNMYFYNIGASNKHEMIGPRGDWELNRITEIREKLGHTESVIDILKIDIEKYEWGVLQDIIKSGDIHSIRQILVELHTPSHQVPMKMEDYVEACNILHELKQSGFAIFKYRTGNCCGGFSDLLKLGGRRICCYEVSYVNTNFLA